MKFLLLLLFFLLSTKAFADSIPADTLKLGDNSSTTHKELIFDTGLGVLNPSLKVDYSTSKFSLNKQLTTNDVTFSGTSTIVQNSPLTLGDGTDKDFSLLFDRSSSDAYIKFDNSSSKLVFSNDGVVEKKIGSGGGGAAGYNNLDNSDFEDGITSNWSCTSSRCTEESSSPLIGDKSLNFTPAAQNDYFQSTLKAIPEGLKGVACEARFVYDGGDENLTALVLNGDAEVIATQTLTAHNQAGSEALFFLCPNKAEIIADSDKGDLQLKIVNSTATASLVATFDSMHLGENTGLATMINDNRKEYSEANGDFTVTGGSWTTNFAVAYYYMIGDSHWIRINILGDWAPASANIGLTISGIDLAFTQSVDVGMNGTTSGEGQTSGANIFNLNVSSATGTIWTASGDFKLTAKPDWADEVNEVLQVYKSIPKVADNINDFSARIANNGSAASVANENATFISSTARNGAGDVTVNFIAGVFTEIPSVTATAETENRYNSIKSISISSARISCYDSADGLSDCDFTIKASKQDADYKLPSVQPILVNQVETSYEKGVTSESCEVNNSGSATIDTTSGLCESWISSVTRTSAGSVTVDWTGSFSKQPVCICAANSGNNSYCSFSTRSLNSAVVRTGLTSTGAAADYNFSIECKGAR